MRVDSNSKRRQSSDRAPAPRRSVYDGQDRLGDFQQCADGFVARDRQSRIIGTFPTATAAIDAVAAAGATA